MNLETTFCSNCKRDISTANFVMHEMHCRRHIMLCEHCQEPVPRSEMKEHFNEFHIKLPCEKCKLNIEKDKMEQHMSHECERRLLLCEYCELEFPKNEFESHSDFCGSRTECCPLCQQYVMLKDMRQHENSGCTYPPRKPTPPPQSSPQGVEMDPFSMAQMHQLLGGEDFGGPRVFPELTTSVLQGYVRNGERRRNLGAGEDARRNILTKNVARGTRKDPVRKKTDVNLQRANISGAAVEIPPDMDYDAMLALQLAHDDWLQDEQIERDGILPEVSNMEPPPYEASPWRRDLEGIEPPSYEASVWSRNANGIEQLVSNRNQFEEGDATIPCEFCNTAMPLEDYMDHVETCTGRADVGESIPHQDLNNETSPLLPMVDRPSIPVINNLGSPSLMPRFQDILPEQEDQYLLPCEFCEEMFPYDIIIQHQSVCQANGLATPRVVTPASFQHRNISHTSQELSSFNLSNQRSNGHVAGPSLLDFLADFDENHFGNDMEDQRVPESRSNKYNAPVDRFDEDVARPPRRSSRPNLSEDTLNQAAQRSPTELVSRHAKRENLSAQRARARLNQLLQDDSDGAHMASGITGASAIRPVPTEKKTNVDSRSVMRQLDATRPKTNINRSNGAQGPRRIPVDNNVSRCNRYSSNNTVSRNSSSSSNNNVSRNHSSNTSSTSQTSSSGARSRQRSNHVFSPELRLKPDHNPKTRKQ